MKFIELSSLAILVFLTACGPEVDDSLPTQEEQEETVSVRCMHYISCGADGNDITVDECLDHRLASYNRSRECLEVLYAFDVCIVDSTCEEAEELIDLRRGNCAEEWDDVTDLENRCIPPNNEVSSG